MVRASAGSRQSTKYARLEVSGDQVTSIDILEDAPQVREEDSSSSHPTSRFQRPSALDLLMEGPSSVIPPTRENGGNATNRKATAPSKKSRESGNSTMSVTSPPGSLTARVSLATPKILSRRDTSMATSMTSPQPPSLESLNLGAPKTLPSVSLAKGRSPPRSSPQKRTSGTAVDWSNADAKSIRRAEEFDFQANLDLFDKEKIFRELKATDDVPTETRLVSHNRKLRHDEMILDRLPRDGDDTIMMGAKATDAMEIGRGSLQAESLNTTDRSSGLNCPSLPVAPSIPSVDSAILEAIEQHIITSGALTIDQLVENCGRSLAEFLAQQATQVLRLSSDQSLSSPRSNKRLPILLYLSTDRRGAYTLAAGRFLLNRGLSVCAFITGSNTHQRAPLYFGQALRSFQAFGGVLVEAVPKAVSILITTVSTFTVPLRAQATCSLVDSKYDEVTWMIHFGLPSSASKYSSRRPQDLVSILCDAGWPAAMVNEDAQASLDGLAYENIFGASSFVRL